LLDSRKQVESLKIYWINNQPYTEFNKKKPVVSKIKIFCLFICREWNPSVKKCRATWAKSSYKCHNWVWMWQANSQTRYVSWKLSFKFLIMFGLEIPGYLEMVVFGSGYQLLKIRLLDNQLVDTFCRKSTARHKIYQLLESK
jgi:hypothetical protein